MYVEDFVKTRGKAEGYDGIFVGNDMSEPCGCTFDDFAPCGEWLELCADPIMGYKHELVADSDGIWRCRDCGKGCYSDGEGFLVCGEKGGAE